MGFLRRLTPRVRPYVRALAGAAVLLLISTSVSLIFPQVVRQLLDAAFLAGDSTLLNQIALALVALFSFQAVINFSQSSIRIIDNQRQHCSGDNDDGQNG